MPTPEYRNIMPQAPGQYGVKAQANVNDVAAELLVAAYWDREEVTCLFNGRALRARLGMKREDVLSPWERAAAATYFGSDAPQVLPLWSPGEIANGGGDIWLARPGARVVTGRVLVTPEQAERARPFGWRVVERGEGLCLICR